MLLIVPVAVRADQAYDATGPRYYGGSVGASPLDDVLGLGFTPNQDIWVTDLGWWDPAGQTPQGDATVGIANTTGTALLAAPTTIDASATILGSGVDTFAWVPVATPIELYANQTYLLEGFAPSSNGSTWRYDGLFNPTISGALTIQSAPWLYGATGLPAQLTTGNGYPSLIFAGPNFKFTTTAPSSSPVPEPSTLSIFGGLAFMGVCFLARRRKDAR